MTTVSFAPRRIRPLSGTQIVRLTVDLLTAVALTGAFLATITCVYAIAHRIGHPFELEWIEGGSLDEVTRVLHGHALYAAPTVHWTPNIYPPLYYYVGAALSFVFGGASFTLLRAVSVLSTAAAAACIAALVRAETDEMVGPAIACGLVFAMYRIGGEWFDVARVDMFAVALLFAGLLAARIATRPRTAALAALLLVLAVFTKQSALVPALAVVPWLWTRGRRCAIAYVATFGALCATAFALLQVSTNGWFAYFVWTVPSHHELARGSVIGFWTSDLLRRLWPALVLVGAACIAARRNRSLWFHAPVFVALVLSAYSQRLHTGGWLNVLLPAYFGVAMLAGVAVGYARRERRDAVIGAAALAVAVLQFALLSYSPGAMIPSARATVVGDRLINELRGLPGPVLLTGQPWLLTRAGHAADTTAVASALQDVLRAGRGAGRPAQRLQSELERDIRTQRYCTIITEQPGGFTALPRDLRRYYVAVGSLPAPTPVTGMPIVPARVWVPLGAGCAR